MFLPTQIISLFAVFSILQAQQILNPTGEGCIDPTGFLQCYSNIENIDLFTVEDLCAQYTTPSDEWSDCVLAAYYVGLAGNIGRWIQSCWNMLNSCQYQGTCIQYIDNVEGGLLQDTVYIPFYPTPENALASCSCNIGEAYGNLTALRIENELACDNFVYDGQEHPANCQCCQASQILSNVFDLCRRGGNPVIPRGMFLFPRQLCRTGYQSRNLRIDIRILHW